MAAEPRIGTAGWALPRAVAGGFPRAGSGLQRYAARLDCVEINSSFYRPHRAETWERWARDVPAQFRFAVKMPRAITHEARLRAVARPLGAFVDAIGGLGDKLGCVLIQLPPSLAFEPRVAARFLAVLRRRSACAAVIEPRHRDWFGAEADALLAEHAVGRVAADPAVVPHAAEPGGDLRTVYFRLHGSPRMYFSVYDERFLRRLATRVRTASAGAAACWCVFDNTAHGGAAANALRIRSLLAAD